MSPTYPVPMVRQRIEVPEWDTNGGPRLGDRAYWSDRACGMACLRMVLLAYGKDAPPLTALVREGLQRSFYVPELGWAHDGIARMATDYGVEARAIGIGAGLLTSHLSSAPMIVSVAEGLPHTGTRKGGHLIVLTGYDTAPDCPVRFRDPSAWGQRNSVAPLARLTASYSGRAVIFAPFSACCAA